MSAALRAIVLLLCAGACVHAQNRSLAVIPGDTPRLDSSSSAMLQEELQRLMEPARVFATWRPAVHDEFDLLVVAFLDGECSVEQLPAMTPSTAPSGILGETRLSRGARISPFLRVDCAQLIRTLTPVLQPLSIPQRNAVLGRALARVMAHEIYHVLSQAVGHDDSGCAKASFSAQDLIAPHFGFGSSSLRRMAAAAPVPHSAGAGFSRD